MQFGPQPGAAAKFRLTIAVPRVVVVLAGHPREWGGGAPSYEYASPADAPALQPFFHGAVSNLLFDLGTLPPGDVYINICATSLDIQDLRLGYRRAPACACSSSALWEGAMSRVGGGGEV
jgi:hypothetical protein